MSNKSDETPRLVLIEQYLSIYGPFILTSLGIIGNILSILIFLSPRYRRQSSHFYLLSLALSDLCFLIINLFEDTFRNHNQLYQSRINFLDRSSSIICISVEYARNVTRLLSSWIIVSFTIERLLVVFHPLKRAIICRRKIARFVVLIVFLISLLCNLNVPFHYGIIDLPDRKENDTICDILPDYRSIYMRFAISIMTTVYLVPMCIIGFVNMLICCKLWRKSSLMEKDEPIKIRKHRHGFFSLRHLTLPRDLFSRLHFLTRSSSSSTGTKQLQKGRASSLSQCQSIGTLLNTETNLSQFNVNDEHRQHQSTNSPSSTSFSCPIREKHSVCSVKTYIQSRTQRVTATLLLVSCSFLLLNTPYCVLWIANYVQGFRNVTLKSIKEISELFTLTNFCINFLLYCVSGKVFRSELVCLLRCQWRELYERNEVERFAHRKSRPKIEIQLQETKSRGRSPSLYPIEPQRRLSNSSYTNQIPNYS